VPPAGAAGEGVLAPAPAGQGQAAASGTVNLPTIAGGAAALAGQDPGLNAIASLLLGEPGR